MIRCNETTRLGLVMAATVTLAACGGGGGGGSSSGGGSPGKGGGGSSPGGGSGSSAYTLKGVYMDADNQTGGREPWVSNGSKASTQLLKDINGSGGSSFPAGFTRLGSKVLFEAKTAAEGNELWVTDGTPSGTRLLKDINPGPGDGIRGLNRADIFPQGKFDGDLYFAASNGNKAPNNGFELWRTDGTKKGTEMVADIAQGASGTTPEQDSNPADFITLAGDLYFSAANGKDGRELYRFDSKGVVTRITRESKTDVNYIGPPTRYNGALYFKANTPSSYAEIWKSDGSPGLATKVTNIAPGKNSKPLSLTRFDNELYFSAITAAEGRELYHTNGTGQNLVKDINNSSDSSLSSRPQRNKLIPYDGNLYFVADNGSDGAELWLSDGTSAGTKMVKDINPGSGSGPKNSAFAMGMPGVPVHLTVFKKKLYFLAHDNNSATRADLDLWRTDGTKGGTEKVRDANGNRLREYAPFGQYDGSLFLVGFGSKSNDLWRTNGTAKGTFKISDVSVSGLRVIR